MSLNYHLLKIIKLSLAHVIKAEQLKTPANLLKIYDKEGLPRQFLIVSITNLMNSMKTLILKACLTLRNNRNINCWSYRVSKIKISKAIKKKNKYLESAIQQSDIP